MASKPRAETWASFVGRIIAFLLGLAVILISAVAALAAQTVLLNGAPVGSLHQWLQSTVSVLQVPL